jgi:flagellar basal body-associated protein FliL
MLFILGVIVAAVVVLLTTYWMFFRSSDEMYVNFDVFWCFFFVCKLTLVISCFYSHKISHHFCSDEVVVEKKSQPNASKKEEKVEKEEEAIAGPLTVFFGSQTGKLFVFVCFVLFCFTLH